GFPFAAPPVGDLRWRAPRPVEAWDTPLEATFPFNRCAQLTSSFEPDREEGELAGKEDCLYLNVWAPSNSDSEPKPVMVWIHGGANVWGYAGQYEMGRLAQSQDVVVVGINYRLAMMGWFGHPSIVSTAETDLA
ncbi:MAG TPA: carboxylesterase, partial [Hyphomonas atlantica]|nr:carboxylesterase [Hyphomonas atlantica]